MKLIKPIEKVKERMVKILGLISVALMNFQIMTTNCYAAGIGQSKLFTGTKQLFNDMKTPLIALSAVIALVLIIFNLIRMKMAEDDADAKIYKKKIRTILIAAIGVVVAAATLTTILSYYSS